MKEKLVESLFKFYLIIHNKHQYLQIKKELDKKSYHNYEHSLWIFKRSNLSFSWALAAFYHDSAEDSVDCNFYIINTDLPKIFRRSLFKAMNMIIASKNHDKLSKDIDEFRFQIIDLSAYLCNHDSFSKVRKEYYYVSDFDFYTARLKLLLKIQKTLVSDQCKQKVYESFNRDEYFTYVSLIIGKGFSSEIDALESKLREINQNA